MKDRIHGWFHKQERARWSLRWRITGNADTNFSLQCFQWCHSFCFCQGRRSWLVKDNKYMKDRFHRSACSSFHLYKQVWRVCQARPLPAQVRTCFHCFPSFCSLFSLMNAERRLTCRDQTHTIVTTYYHISQPSAQALLRLNSSHEKGSVTADLCTLFSSAFQSPISSSSAWQGNALAIWKKKSKAHLIHNKPTNPSSSLSLCAVRQCIQHKPVQKNHTWKRCHVFQGGRMKWNWCLAVCPARRSSSAVPDCNLFTCSRYKHFCPCVNQWQSSNGANPPPSLPWSKSTPQKQQELNFK